MVDESIDEFFPVVDENDKVIGKERRSIVHRKGLWHRAVYVFILNGKGKIFLQQRSDGKDFFPGSWDMSAAEHLKVGESYEQGVERGVNEELGVKVVEMEKLGEKEYRFKSGDREDNEFNWVYRVEVEGKIKLDEEEIQAGKWVGKEELLKEMSEKPENFTQWLLNCRDIVEKL